MTSTQEKDLFIEWSLYGAQKQRMMIDEYLSITNAENCSKDKFLSFLKDKLRIEGYWKKIGLV